MRNLKGRSGLSLVLIILFAILGGLLGEFLGNNVQSLALLKEFYSIGFTEPLTLDLGIVSIVLGITFKLNIMSMLGIIFAIFVVKKF